MANILVIEDDSDLLLAYEATLSKQLGHRLLKSMDGVDGLIKARREKFHLIITDLKLPRVSGSEIIFKLLQEPFNAECPILVLSGFIDDFLIKKLAPVQRVHFLHKPTSGKNIIDMVDRILTPPAKPGLDVRFVNPILTASMVTIIENGFQIKKTLPPYKKKPNETSGDLSVMTGLVSAGFKGSFSLSFPEAGYLRLLKNVYQVVADEINADNQDAAVEVLNTILARGKKGLNEQGLNIESTGPSLVIGKAHKIDHSSAFPTIVIVFECEELGHFRVELCACG